MSDFFGEFYCTFQDFFGTALATYLWGYRCTTDDYSGSIIFNQIGLCNIGISLGIVILYYYIINSPKFNRWWSWTIMLSINAITSLFIGYYWVYNDAINGNIDDCLMFQRSEEGEIIATNILNSDCWGFGIANLLISIILFIVLSALLNWKSSSCRHSPFIELTN